jgi:hypothetical protein
LAVLDGAEKNRRNSRRCESEPYANAIGTEVVDIASGLPGADDIGDVWLDNGSPDATSFAKRTHLLASL